MHYTAPGVQVVPSLTAALQACADAAKVFVIGGAQIYALALPCAQYVMATEIHAQVQGDTFFPPLPAGQWREVIRLPQAPQHGYAYDFVTYARVQEHSAG
jgi:dihydrofolate reductase